MKRSELVPVFNTLVSLGDSLIQVAELKTGKAECRLKLDFARVLAAKGDSIFDPKETFEPASLLFRGVKEIAFDGPYQLIPAADGYELIRAQQRLTNAIESTLPSVNDESSAITLVMLLPIHGLRMDPELCWTRTEIVAAWRAMTPSIVNSRAWYGYEFEQMDDEQQELFIRWLEESQTLRSRLWATLQQVGAQRAPEAWRTLNTLAQVAPSVHTLWILSGIIPAWAEAVERHMSDDDLSLALERKIRLAVGIREDLRSLLNQLSDEEVDHLLVPGEVQINVPSVMDWLPELLNRYFERVQESLARILVTLEDEEEAEDEAAP